MPNNLRTFLFALVLCFCSTDLYAYFPEKKELHVRKYGPYIGVEKGRYFLPRIGFEYQWKTVGIFRGGQTHALHLGMNYNVRHSIVGYDLGYWTKSGALGWTFGGNINYRTDFVTGGFGISPVIGFSFMQFHIETGYTFYAEDIKQLPVNSLFIGIRLVLIRDRKISID